VTDLRQMIIDRATACMEQDIADGEAPIRWTPADLAEAITDEKWTDGATHTCDLAEIAGTLNSRFKDRRPVETEEAEDCDEEGPTLEAPNGTPWLLPMANTDYDLDPFGIPHARRRQRVKGGPVSLDKFFTFKGKKKSEGEKPRFVCGYRLRVDGHRRRFKPSYLILARYFAEQKWLSGDEG
jgi:hypothetical protein